MNNGVQLVFRFIRPVFGGICLVVFSLIVMIHSSARADNPTNYTFAITSCGDQTSPAVVYNALAKEFLVVYENNCASANITKHISAWRLTENGTLTGSELAIATSTTVQRGSPSVAVNTELSDYLIVWYQHVVTGNMDILGQMITTKGDLIGSPISVSTRLGRQISPAVAYCADSDNGTYLIIWQEDEDAVQDPGWNFFTFGQLLNGDGQLVSDTITVTANYTELIEYFPQQVDPVLVYNANGNVFMTVYRDARYKNNGADFNDDIFGQLMSCKDGQKNDPIKGHPIYGFDLPVTLQFSPEPGGNKQNFPAIAVDNRRGQVLAVWEDYRDDPDVNIPGVASNIYGQFFRRDGAPLFQSVNINFPIVTTAGDQRQPSVAYSSQSDVYLVVWTDNPETDANIYGQFLLSSGQLWGEEFVISDTSGKHLHPLVTHNEHTDQFLVVWQDGPNQNSGIDIYGRLLPIPSILRRYFPIIHKHYPQPWPPNNAEVLAKSWLTLQTRSFTEFGDIPGYNFGGCSGEVARYNNDGTICNPAILGDVIDSFDYCHYGTPEQRRLGQFGRAFLYDQAVGAIAWLMVEETEKAQRILDHLSSYQNQDGSFGFSFNSVGCETYAPNNKDSFYDKDHLRSGAISWAGYAFVMYYRQTGDNRYLDEAQNIAEYLLTQRQDEIEDCFGLVRGGELPAPHWFVSTEHNIDAYFFLRDLGEIMPEYMEPAIQIKDCLLKVLWRPEKGRFARGFNDEGLDNIDTLDAASWGAIFLLAVGETEKAQQSLDFATATYFNFANGIWGYKPNAGDKEMVKVEDDSNVGHMLYNTWDDLAVSWQEGSLGVAMAYLKMGGMANQTQAEKIIAEVAKVQARDPDGGIMYAVYNGGEVQDFSRAPSVASTGWFVMTWQAWKNPSSQNLFWGITP